MGKTFRTGVCLIAILAVGIDVASARHKSLKCADESEVSALQTAAVQQELMDAALGCGHPALEKFNAFQISFGPELRRSDRTLLTMFKRVYGPARGDAAYNLFKTDMASKAEIRRIHGVGDFCAAADAVFAAALGAEKPSLTAFVAGVEIEDTEESPVGHCDIRVAVTLQGAMGAASVVPKPNPLRVATAAPVERTPASLTRSMPPTSAQERQASQEAPAEQPKEKKASWLSGLFH